MNNHLTFKRIAATAWTEISDWFSSNRYFNEDSFITRLRYFQITAFSFLFVTSFLNFLNNLVSSYIITSTVCLALIVVRFLLDSNKIKEAYALMLYSVNLGLIMLTCAEGLRSGVFLFFFPSIISFSFLTDLANKKNVLLTYLVGIGSFFMAVTLAPDSIIFGGVSKESGSGGFFFKVILSFSLIVWMSFNLAKENNRKQAELRNKEVFLDTIFNSSLHTEIIVDIENGLVSNCNEHAASMFSAPGVEDLFNIPACEFFLELKGGSNEDLLKEMCNLHGNWSGELTCCRMDGTVFPGSISVVSFKYNDKVYKKITIVDITEKNEILSELQVAKNKAEESAHIKSQFLSHMSHELRTPLNGIIGSSNLLLQDIFLPAQKEQLEILKFSSEHMLSLINDILDLSKLEADRIQLEKAVVDIPRLINSISSPFIKQAEEKGILFKVKVDADLKRAVLADPTRLNQVLTNLLSNALKFTSKGSVKLEVKGISVKSDSNTIQFSVTDTGIGIGEDKRKQIFEQFTQADVKTTRKYGGTGLGLTISQKLVRLMGGDIVVESKYHKGSRFSFEITLPVHNSRKKIHLNEFGAETLNGNQRLKGYKVLIAEDNPVNMIIASKFLDKWGVSYEKARNGLEAVSLFGKNNFDLVLMDLEMPEMDGYGALNAIREINPDIPAIAFTAAVFDNMKESLLESGFNDYIQKPFKPLERQVKIA
jgi:CheY-like chemotaxis protein/nitrogen-specific signal transduction histidine kinase